MQEKDKLTQVGLKEKAQNNSLNPQSNQKQAGNQQQAPQGEPGMSIIHVRLGDFSLYLCAKKDAGGTWKVPLPESSDKLNEKQQKEET